MLALGVVLLAALIAVAFLAGVFGIMASMLLVSEGGPDVTLLGMGVLPVRVLAMRVSGLLGRVLA